MISDLNIRRGYLHFACTAELFRAPDPFGGSKILEVKKLLSKLKALISKVFGEQKSMQFFLVRAVATEQFKSCSFLHRDITEATIQTAY